jgi:NAD(P)-dependent dehydrogenase (short-subunit alcohol dehydrogenase family)
MRVAVRGAGAVATALRELVDAVEPDTDDFEAIFLGAAPAVVGAVADLAVADFDAVLEDGLVESFRILARALPRLAATGGAVVLEVSAAAVRASRRTAARAAIDTALVGLGRAAGLEYAADGVRVNLLLVEGADAADAARMALHLLSPAAAGVNAAVVAVDGGATACAYPRTAVPDA